MIDIYGTPYCAFCKRAVKLATEYDLKFMYHNIDEDKEAFKQMFPEATSIPQIVWNGVYIGGYDEFAGAVVDTIGGYGEGQL